MGTARTRWIFRGVLAACVLVVLAAVLTPQPVLESTSLADDGPFSMGWLADALRNVLLFVPFGAAAFLATRSTLRSVALAFALAIGIELLQTGIPGRFSSPLDVLSNSLGGGLGAWLMLHRNEIRSPDRRFAAWISPISSLVAVLVLLAGSALLAPEVPDGTYFGGWTPELRNFAPYKGQVIAAVLDGLEIPAAGPARNGPDLQRELRDDAALAIAMRVGPRPEALAPVVTIHDQDQREILLVGIDGDDLVVRRRLRAAAFGLENPSRSWRDRLRASRAGDRQSIDLQFDGADWRAALGGDLSSARSWTPGRGWALLVPEAPIADGVARWLDGLWIAALTFPAAYHAGRRILAVGSLAAIAGAMVGIPWFGSLVAPGLAEWIGFGGSLAVGLGLGGRFTGSTLRR